jgi:hypothetical protein
MSAFVRDASEREAKAGGAAFNQPGKLLLGRREHGRHGCWFRVGENLANSKVINSVKSVKQQV